MAQRSRLYEPVPVRSKGEVGKVLRLLRPSIPRSPVAMPGRAVGYQRYTGGDTDEGNRKLARCCQHEKEKGVQPTETTF